MIKTGSRKKKLCIGVLFCIFTLIILHLMGCANKNSSECLVGGLTVNYRENPFGIDENPLFSWKMLDDTPGQFQTAYRIVVGKSEKDLKEKRYVWDSEKKESDLSVAIPYEGQELETETRYFWQVFVWDKDGKENKSETAFFETGILDDNWEGAQWIGVKKETNNAVLQTVETSYTVEYDFSMGNSYSGLIWGADNNHYEEYFLWAFDTRGEEIEFVAARKKYEDVLEEEHISLAEWFPDKEVFCDTVHHVQLTIAGCEVETYVDDILIAHTHTAVAKAPVNVGFEVARGAYYAKYDNLLVVDSQENVLYDEDFEDENDTIFSPYYVNVVDGWAQATSGYLVVPGSETPAPMFRKCFTVNNHIKIVSARLYATAMGIYDIYVNGSTVSEEYMSPGQSTYSDEVYYRTYDVTGLLQGEENAVGVMLGHGRYDRAKGSWGDNLAFCMKLVLLYEDGTKQVIVSDESWKTYRNGPIRNDDMFYGEYYDAAYEIKGWAEASCEDSDWEPVSMITEENGKAITEIVKKAACSEPVVCVEELKPVAVTEPQEGVYVYDFGQNFTGFCKIELQGKKGQVVTLRYAEALNEEDMSCKDDSVGTIWTENLYTAHNVDYYVVAGEEEESYEATFACRGFRYVQISGIDEPLPLESVTGKVISTKNQRTGYITSSDERINKLYQSIYWSQLSNYVDIPTDCPQRDERFGWAGDAQVFAKTASYNANIYSFMDKYIDALRLTQEKTGIYPEIAPAADKNGGSNGWSDAGIILVWELYQQYGNKEIITENLDSMSCYMDYLVETSEQFIRYFDGYSDHNAVSELEDEVCNTAQCAYVASLLSKMAKIVGSKEIADKYLEVYDNYKTAWQNAYINEDGTIGSWLQSAYTLGLAFGLYPEELEESGALWLSKAVEANDYHLNTGYVATPHLLPMLCKYGYKDTAYKILLQDSYPSWLYMLKRGGTTITEGWHTYYELEDGSYGINGSLNHYALGSVGAWMYSDMLGIKRDEECPAFKHFYLEPQISQEITYVTGSYDSMYGKIESEWKWDGNEVVFHFVIPANTSATVTLPCEQYQNMELTAGEYEYRIPIDMMME